VVGEHPKNSFSNTKIVVVIADDIDLYWINKPCGRKWAGPFTKKTRLWFFL
jgi:hypothetical protein